MNYEDKMGAFRVLLQETRMPDFEIILRMIAYKKMLEHGFDDPRSSFHPKRVQEGGVKNGNSEIKDKRKIEIGDNHNNNLTHQRNAKQVDIAAERVRRETKRKYVFCLFA